MDQTYLAPTRIVDDFNRWSKRILYMSCKKISSISLRWQRIQDQEQKYLAELWKKRESSLHQKAVEEIISI